MQGVGTNAIKCSCTQCTGCVKWTHKRCCGVVGSVQDVDASIYRFPQCAESGDVVFSVPVEMFSC